MKLVFGQGVSGSLRFSHIMASSERANAGPSRVRAFGSIELISKPGKISLPSPAAASERKEARPRGLVGDGSVVFIPGSDPADMRELADKVASVELQDPVCSICLDE